MAKQDCPFCGKPQIDGRHIRLCPQRPQEAQENPSISGSVESVAPEVTTPIFEPIMPPKKADFLCPVCGSDSIKLNVLDYRCPKCGDREIKQPLPAGVK